LSDEDFSNKRAQLFDLIRNGDIESVRQLLSTDRKLVNLPYIAVGLYPVHTAADVGQLEILQLLVSLGADVNQQDSEGQTPLHYGNCIFSSLICWFLGAANGYYALVKYLIDAGTNPQIKCNDGLTALDSATDSDIIDLLKGV
jgi:ankyrin repeat protein